MLWILLAFIGAAAEPDGDKSERSIYMGYHRTIGIPEAARIKEIERQIIEDANDDGINSRIIGGYPTIHERYPWLVGLIIKGDVNSPYISMCGGSMLDMTRILTAGHCIMEKDFTLDYVEAVFGSNYLFHGGMRVRTILTVTHPRWKGEHHRRQVDAGIVFIPDLRYSDSTIKPVALPTTRMTRELFTGYSAHAAGYGRIRYVKEKQGFKKGVPEVNYEVELEINTDACANETVPDWYLCTYGRLGEGNVGICSGDSGGPLTITLCGKDILVGIIIRSLINCESGGPSYYTRVGEILDFIFYNKYAPVPK